MDHTTVSRERWQDHWLFLTHFRKSPRTVGAIAPSSRRLARAMLDGLSLEPARRVRVVELGPGTGAVTGEIASRLPADAACLAIDVDPVFSARVGARWPRSTRCAIGPSDSWRSRAHATCCRSITSCPACRLRACRRRAPARSSRRSSRRCGSGGTFTTFQYVHAYGFPSAVSGPSDPDAGNGIVARPHARPRQPAPGIGAPLAQAQIGRAP